MAKSKPQGPPPPETLSFEEAVAELESIVERIEGGEIGLQETLEARRRGEALLTRCRAILDAAEAELEQAARAADDDA